jgi:RNase adaptor protein for sRNA GlmZ degradation
MDGRDKQIQKRICRASAFDFLLRTTIKHIEGDDLKRISVNCSRGKHRSVAFAEILRDYYYPKAKVLHPNLRG